MWSNTQLPSPRRRSPMPRPRLPRRSVCCYWFSAVVVVATAAERQGADSHVSADNQGAGIPVPAVLQRVNTRELAALQWVNTREPAVLRGADIPAPVARWGADSPAPMDSQMIAVVGDVVDSAAVANVADTSCRPFGPIPGVPAIMHQRTAAAGNPTLGVSQYLWAPRSKRSRTGNRSRRKVRRHPVTRRLTSGLRGRRAPDRVVAHGWFGHWAERSHDHGA